MVVKPPQVTYQLIWLHIRRGSTISKAGKFTLKQSKCKSGTRGKCIFDSGVSCLKSSKNHFYIFSFSSLFSFTSALVVLTRRLVNDGRCTKRLTQRGRQSYTETKMVHLSVCGEANMVQIAVQVQHHLLHTQLLEQKVSQHLITADREKVKVLHCWGAQVEGREESAMPIGKCNTWKEGFDILRNIPFFLAFLYCKCSNSVWIFIYPHWKKKEIQVFI